MVPKSTRSWLYFAATVAVAIAVLNSISRRVPAVAQLMQGI